MRLLISSPTCRRAVPGASPIAVSVSCRRCATACAIPGSPGSRFLVYHFTKAIIVFGPIMPSGFPASNPCTARALWMRKTRIFAHSQAGSARWAAGHRLTALLAAGPSVPALSFSSASCSPLLHRAERACEGSSSPEWMESVAAWWNVACSGNAPSMRCAPRTSPGIAARSRTTTAEVTATLLDLVVVTGASVTCPPLGASSWNPARTEIGSAESGIRRCART